MSRTLVGNLAWERASYSRICANDARYTLFAFFTQVSCTCMGMGMCMGMGTGIRILVSSHSNIGQRCRCACVAVAVAAARRGVLSTNCELEIEDSANGARPDWSGIITSPLPRYHVMSFFAGSPVLSVSYKLMMMVAFRKVVPNNKFCAQNGKSAMRCGARENCKLVFDARVYSHRKVLS